MPLALLMRLMLARSLMLAPDAGGGGGGADDPDDDTGDTDTDDTDDEDDPDDPGDDPAKLKAALAAKDAEVAKWKAQSRKHEERAKKNRTAAQERDELQRKGLPPDEQALAKARDEGKAEAAKAAGIKIAKSEVRGELKGRVGDAQRDALIDALDLSRFLDDDNDVDTDKVKEWVDSVAPKKKSDKDNDGTDTGPKKKATNLGQGRRTSGGGKGSVEDGGSLYERMHPTKS